MIRVGVLVAALVCSAWTGLLVGEEPALKLRAVAAGTSQPLTIELFRWSTDGERAPLLAALETPPQGPSPDAAAPATAAPAGRGARGARGGARGGGGRGGGAPQTPAARLAAAIKAAPTVGFIWGDGPTGYSIKYAWRSASPDGRERVVLATDRRLGAHSTPNPAASQAPAAAPDAEFTVLEVRIDGKGRGEAKTSLASPVVIDAAAKTLALDAYADATAQFEVTR